MTSLAIIPEIDAVDDRGRSRTSDLNWYFKAFPDLEFSSPSQHADLYLVTDISERNLPKNFINVDPLMSADVPGELSRALLKTAGQPSLAGTHKRRFLSWSEKIHLNNGITIYGPGPSGALQGITPNSFNCITGAELVADCLSKHAKVDAIIIADAVALLGNTPFANALRKDIINLQNETGAVFITTLASAALLQPHWPAPLKEKLLGIPEDFNADFTKNLTEDFSVFPTGNVLTTLILPVAKTVSRKITLKGFDGALGVSGFHHRDKNLNKSEIFRSYYGVGFLFSEGYSDQLQGDVDEQIYHLTSRNHEIFAPGWQPGKHKKITPKPNTGVYDLAEILDRRPLAISLVAGLITGIMIFAGTKFMTTQSQIIIAGAIAAAAFVLGFLHLRKRAKRLADLAERRASEKSSRAFNALAERVDALENQKD